MTQTKQKTWCGSTPRTCQLCQLPITNIFVDGKTIHGPWAIMCDDCHAVEGCGLGVGRGQKYEKQGDQWVKVEG